MTDDGVIDAIFAAFTQRGNTAYVGEPVSLTEHMLQTGLDTPPLSHYRPALRAGLRSATPARR
jgi:hypothetical protein